MKDEGYGILEGYDVILSEKQENDELVRKTQKWEEVKLEGGWMKLKRPERVLFLHVSEDGEKLTTEKDSKGMLHFI